MPNEVKFIFSVVDKTIILRPRKYITIFVLSYNLHKSKLNSEQRLRYFADIAFIRKKNYFYIKLNVLNCSLEYSKAVLCDTRYSTIHVYCDIKIS